MALNTQSLFSLRSWLIYAEVLAVVGFVVLASLYIRRGECRARIAAGVTDRYLY